MADFRIKFNPEKDDVELLLGDNVVDTVGTEVFESWVNAYNEKHGYVKPEETPGEEVTPTTEEE